jgi:hypothetical protein
MAVRRIDSNHTHTHTHRQAHCSVNKIVFTKQLGMKYAKPDSKAKVVLQDVLCLYVEIVFIGYFDLVVHGDEEGVK